MRFTPMRLAQAVPVAELPSILRSLRTSNRAYDRRLTHVTSEKLCDDVLRVLQPSLPLPQTCDVIDINPGPCLWSRKLHDLLKPRRHILVEPESRRKVFTQFLDPLLALKDSPFRYAKSLKTALDPKEELLSEDIYHFRQNHSNEAQQYPYNRTLLITANLSGLARKVEGFIGSETKLFLHNYYREIYIREHYLHRYGLVRLLAWISEDSRVSIMPMSVNSRTKQSVQLEAVSKVDQVAGPAHPRNLYPHQKRWYYLDVENQQYVRNEQKRQGFNIAPERAQPDPVLPFLALKPNITEVRKHKDSYPFNQVYIRRVLDLDNYLSTERPSWYASYQVEVDQHFRDSRSAKARKYSNDPKERTYRRLMTQLRTHHNTYLKAKDFVWEQRKLFKDIQNGFTQGWFSSATGLPLEGPNQKMAEKLIQDDDALDSQRRSIKRDTRTLIIKAGDDYRTYDSKFKSIPWNSRQFDPLLVKDSEFFPHQPLTLIDFKPNPELPMKLNTINKQICFDYVCTLLMANAGETITQGIKRLISAGHDQFLERVPELRDPTKGGWWNLDRVRVRSMHVDLFVALALAFHDWPHRPEISKLMAVYKGVFDKGPI